MDEQEWMNQHEQLDRWTSSRDARALAERDDDYALAAHVAAFDALDRAMSPVLHLENLHARMESN